MRWMYQRRISVSRSTGTDVPTTGSCRWSSHAGSNRLVKLGTQTAFLKPDVSHRANYRAPLAARNRSGPARRDGGARRQPRTSRTSGRHWPRPGSRGRNGAAVRPGRDDGRSGRPGITELRRQPAAAAATQRLAPEGVISVAMPEIRPTRSPPAAASTVPRSPRFPGPPSGSAVCRLAP